MVNGRSGRSALLRWGWRWGARLLPLVACCLMAQSCSLMGLSEFDLPECASDEECQLALNEQSGHPAGCAAFQCKKVGGRKQCVELDEEICDGFDNDCDFVVDEAEEGQPLLTVLSEPYASGVTRAQSVSLVSSLEFGDLIYISDPLGESSVSVAGPESSWLPLEDWTQPEPENGASYARSELADLASGCYQADGHLGECAVSEAVVAAGEQVAFFAQLDTQACPSGELRVGVVQPNHAERLIDRGRGARDPSYRGVATFGSLCSSNGSQACADAKALEPDEELDANAVIAACGTSAPSIAALSDQGFVSFVGLSAASKRCENASPVFGLGVYRGQGELEGEPFYWSNPTNDGTPEVLGQTSGGAPPAVIAVAEAGFVVGFGDAGGQLQLAWVPRQPAPSAQDGLTCAKADPLCDSREAASTAPLRGLQRLGQLGGVGRFDGVRLASQTLADDLFALAVTWVDGCTREPGAALTGYAQIVALDLTAPSARLTPVGPVLELGEVQVPPWPLPSAGPFVVPKFSRTPDDPASPSVSEPTSGLGFYVVLGGTEPSARRVLVFDGQFLDPEEVLAIPAEAGEVVAGIANGAFASLDRNGERLVRAAVGCE